MKKKMLFLIVVVLIAVMVYLYTRPTMPVLSIEKVYGIANVGDTVLVNVTLSNVQGCLSARMTLVWDPVVIRLTTNGPNSKLPAEGGDPVDIYEGNFFRTAGGTLFVINTADNQLGFADFGVVSSSTEGASGTGVVVTINFTILSMGSTTVETRPPTPAFSQSVIVGQNNKLIAHDEVYGLVTKDGAPPMWASVDLQSNLIIVEVVVLAVASGLVYWRVHPRVAKAEKRKAELRPIIAPEDQRETG